jgi:hypothetical protein
MTQHVTQQRTVIEDGHVQHSEGRHRHLAFVPVKKREEKWKDTVGVARDVSCEYYTLRNRVGDRRSNARGHKGQEGGQDADNLIPRFRIVIQEYDIENISRTEAVTVGKVNGLSMRMG